MKMAQKAKTSKYNFKHMEENINPTIVPVSSKFPILPVVITAVLAAAITFGATYWFLVRTKPVSDNPTPTPVNNQTPQQTYSTSDYRYVLKNLNELKPNWDQQILRVNKQTKEETVVVASVKTALPELKASFNLVLGEFAQPYDSTKVIYNKLLSETDSPPATLYSLDTKTGTLSKMKINDFLGDFPSFRNFIRLSPDKSR